ncbi:MAG: PilZ domain-containing protein [Pseudomonadota bacterium]
MTQKTEHGNRRKFPRFTATTDLFVIHGDFGKILEIGIGGAAFTYVEKDCQRNGHSVQGTLFSREEDYLVELPFRTISDTVVSQSTSHRLNIRKRVVVFDELSDNQLEKLEKFILDNVALPVTDAC